MNHSSCAQKLRNKVYESGDLPIDLRKKRLEKLRDVIRKKEVLINQGLKADLGKSAFESYLTESGYILEELKFTLKHLASWTHPQKVKTPIRLYPGRSKIYPSAYGVVLIISPWNYPLQLALLPLISAFAAGNRIVLKPSELSGHTSRVIREIVEEVFQDDEVIVVTGGIQETEALLKEKWDYIFFTGSSSVGKIILKSAAENLTPVTLELGGKSPCLVEESANLEVAAKRCVWGKFLNAGQTCVAPDYVLIPRKHQDEFIKKIGFYIDAFYGKDIRTSNDYSRIIDEKNFDRLKNLLHSSVKIVNPTQDCREEKFFPPVILKDVTWDDEIMREEIFGPILPVIPYDNLEEVIRKIVSRPRPLAFYLFSENKKIKEDIIKKVPFGGGCVNDTVLHLANPFLPFGGVGASGFGSYHGKKSFETFSHFKSVFENGSRLDVPVRYPPYEGKLSWLKSFLR